MNVFYIYKYIMEASVLLGILGIGYLLNNNNQLIKNMELIK